MSDTKEIVKIISTNLRTAQNHMFSRKYEEARELASKIQESIEKITVMEPENIQLKSFTTQLTKLNKDLDAKTAIPASPSPSTSTTKTQPNIPAGVTKRIRDIRQILSYKPNDLENAKQFLSEIKSQYQGQFPEDYPEYLQICEDLERAFNERGKKEQQQLEEKGQKETDRKKREEESEAWICRIKALGPFSFFTADVDGFLTQEQIFKEASALFQEYVSFTFSAGKNEILDQKEKELQKNLENYPAIRSQCLENFFREVESHLESRKTGLSKKMENKTSVMSENSVEETQKIVDRVSPLSLLAPEAFKKIHQLWISILEHNKQNRVARSKEIFMKDNLYQGEDTPAIIDCTEKLALKKNPGAKIRKTVITSDWKEISQWEPYENTQRFVTRGEIYAQCALETKEQLKLATIYVTREKQTQGWSSLTGNVMYQEIMAIDNLS